MSPKKENLIKIGKKSVLDSEIIIAGENVKIGDNVLIRGRKIVLGNNCEINDNVIVNCDQISLKDNCTIHNGCRFNVKNITVGENATIGQGVSVTGPGKEIKREVAEEFSIGDNTFIGNKITISVPVFKAGDYCTLHHYMNIYDCHQVTMGHNCWFGQEVIINSRKTVTMGNNVRVGMRSQIWTHSASGEIIEGTQLFSEKEVIIEDNVWLNGTVIIAPGLRLRPFSVVMTGSVLTKDTESFHIYAGVPAKDITDKITPYKTPTLNEKYNIMGLIIEEFYKKRPEHKNKIYLLEYPQHLNPNIPSKGVIIIFKDSMGTSNYKENSVFDIKTKTYYKVRTTIEIDFIKENLGHNARFTPNN